MDNTNETAEGAAPSDTDQNVSFLSVSVKKYAGQQTFSVELLDRSSPAFFSELVRQMEFGYAKATDAAVGNVIAQVATDGAARRDDAGPATRHLDGDAGRGQCAPNADCPTVGELAGGRGVKKIRRTKKVTDAQAHYQEKCELFLSLPVTTAYSYAVFFSAVYPKLLETILRILEK